ncbi:hypothetical protein BC826DRAFT_1113121 [Russula brevipes]|nr:hypothetical protein BC826DRAFT_1113121 [Russula brevipes]
MARRPSPVARRPSPISRLLSPVARSPALTHIALAMHACSALIDEVASAAAPAACPHLALIDELSAAAADDRAEDGGKDSAPLSILHSFLLVF